MLADANLPHPILPDGQILIYQDGATRLQVRLEGRTVWLPQRLIAELFQVSVKTVSEYLVNIYGEGELDPGATIRSFRIVRTEGARDVSRAIDHYSLDAILAVGYRVRSARGTAFRQWATGRLSELLVKGFTMDDERLKEGRTIGADYFDELLERIRAIRASERMFYQKITDIYATSIDYDPTLLISQTFFATVQNKLHFAIHGRTAAEVIRARADAGRPHMGLTTWKNAPGGPNHGPGRKQARALGAEGLGRQEQGCLMALPDYTNRGFKGRGDRGACAGAARRKTFIAKSKALRYIANESYRLGDTFLCDNDHLRDND